MRILIIFLTAAAFIAPLAPQTAAPSQQLPIEDAGFVPSGWMGDAEVEPPKNEKADLQVNARSMDHPHSPPYSQQWSYRPRLGHVGWAAIAWQFPEHNFGDKPGRDWSKRGFTKVTLWARGVRDRSGKLPKVQFKAGGGANPVKKYQASFEVAGEFTTLTEDWKQYSLDLTGQNLSQVIAAFIFVIRAEDVGPDGATFFLDDIEYR